MQFNVGNFNRLHANLGQYFGWRRRYACPCVDVDSGAPDYRCRICGGNGHIWEPVVKASATVAGQKTQAKWAQMSQYMDGDVVLTVPENSPMWQAGAFDRMTMMNAPERFSSTLRRGAPNERLYFQPEEIDRVFWRNQEEDGLVDGEPPEVDAEGRLTWGDGAPPAGRSYTMTGRRYPEYFIYQELPRQRRMHSGARMPVQLVVRRFELLGR